MKYAVAQCCLFGALTARTDRSRISHDPALSHRRLQSQSQSQSLGSPLRQQRERCGNRRWRKNLARSDRSSAGRPFLHLSARLARTHHRLTAPRDVEGTAVAASLQRPLGGWQAEPTSASATYDDGSSPAVAGTRFSLTAMAQAPAVKTKENNQNGSALEGSAR